MAKRAKSQEFKVFDGSRRCIGRTSLRGAEFMEMRGIWRRVYSTTSGRLEAFQIDFVEAGKARIDMDLPHTETMTTFSDTDMERVAGCHGKSKTFRLREADRQDLAKNFEMPEDEIERTIAKFRVYPYVGAAQGDILKAWPR